MKKKITLYFLFLCGLSFFSTFSCTAKSNCSEVILSTNKETLNKNDSFRLSIKIISPYKNKLSNLDMKINFDKDKFEFKKSNCKNKDAGLTVTEVCGGNLEISYENNTGFNINAGKLAEIFNLNFAVKQSAKAGETEINAVIKNISNTGFDIGVKDDFDLKKTLNISDNRSCTLISLLPSEGNLNSPFNPDTYDYSVNVPYDVKDIMFDFATRDPEANVDVSRHKLCAAGKTTKIKITVRNKDKNMKLVYTVDVNRAEKPEKEKRKNSQSGKDTSTNKKSKPKKTVPASSSKAKFYSSEEIDEDDSKDLSEKSYGSDDEDNADDETSDVDESDLEDNTESADEIITMNTAGTQKTNDDKNGDMTTLIAAIILTILAFLYSMLKILEIYLQKTLI